MPALLRSWSVLSSGAMLSLALAACDGPRTPVKMPDPNATASRDGIIAALASPHDSAIATVTMLRGEAEKNPLLAPWRGDYGGVPPWDQISAAALPPAFTTALELRDAELAVITSDPAAPTFANTFVPFEDLGRHQDRVETLFAVMTSNLNTPDVQAVDEEWSPKLAAAADRLWFDSKLFARVKAVYDGRETAGLTAEQRRLVERTYERFVHAGAQLDDAGKARLGALNQELAGLFTEFGNKLLADEDTWTVLESTKDLAGLPPSMIASFKAAADERKLPGTWLVMNTRSSVDPFLAASARRDLREKVWKKFKDRGDNGDERDTNATIAKIVALRAERAKLLGYASHAHWRMADTMAVDPAKATELMMKVWPAAVARVREEVKDMQAVAKKEGARITIEPWDYLYYAEKVRKARYDLDAAELEPYFELNNMIAGAMWMAERLYGLHFSEITGTVPVFHPDVRVWKVTAGDGALVGLFYGDYFARAGKRSGAWAMGYRSHETFTGATTLAITSNNNNFVKGAAGAPVLISLDDAETLFHEFGHALHGLLSEVNYPGLATTPRDFVEYPSQVHEQWVLSPPVLDKFARHYQTGAPMPKALLAKVEKSSKFNQGYATVEYLASALVDMELHTRPDGTVDPDAFERETMTRIGAPREVAMRHRLPQFGHLFTSDSYSAGYYSYLWSEVMDADTRQAFIEAGDLFDPTVAGKLRTYILAPGNSTDRAEAYRQFRGRDPDVKALLVKRGFPTK
jgi:peptidyl-dipeptidase Dcp